jgi:predicted Zn-dependent peptidase
MYKKYTLDNGIRVVMEDISYVNSVSIGVWVDNGSIKEDKHINGISHFIEHMLFKGTSNRTAKQIAETIDNIGGQINAFTSKEYTCFYAKVIDSHLPIAIDVLADMINNSLFSEEDIEKEKSVVIEEINMYEDSPEDMVYDLLAETMFENTSLSLPILGTVDTLNNITREKLIDYFDNNYTVENLVISIAGNIKVDETIELLEKKFGILKHTSDKNNNIADSIKFTQKIRGKYKKTEQLNFCIGMEGIPCGNDDIYPLLVLNNIFGGSMSSRLFQKIREEKGLVYSVYSHPSSYKNTGTFTIYAGLSPKQIYNVVNIIKNDIEELKLNLITIDELEKSREQLKGNYILGLESTSSRMAEIGKSELTLGEIYSPKEILEKIDKVTLEDVKETIDKIFNYNKFNIAYVGNITNKEAMENRLKNILFN